MIASWPSSSKSKPASKPSAVSWSSPGLPRMLSSSSMISVGFSWSKFGRRIVRATERRICELSVRSHRKCALGLNSKKSSVVSIWLPSTMLMPMVASSSAASASASETVESRSRLVNSRAAAELQRHRVAEVHRPLDEAVCALVLGVEERQARRRSLRARRPRSRTRGTRSRAACRRSFEPSLSFDPPRKIVFDGSSCSLSSASSAS